jgi:putative ABC transport system ATP-binding protein
MAAQVHEAGPPPGDATTPPNARAHEGDGEAKAVPRQAMVSVIELQDVHKVYATGDTEVRALDGVSLTIETGEFVAIMGPSGSGKSTLMNVLGCLDRPTSGRYVLDGRDVTSLDKAGLAEVRNRTIGFVFQGFNLLSRTSALENVELPLVYSGQKRAERRRRATAALQKVGLSDRMDHLPNQLSGGQQQRVAIARALVNEPRLILADEPTGNLDTKTSLDVMSLFQHLWRAGMTLLVVTHEPDVAAFAQRVITVRDGKVLSDVRQSAKVAQPLGGSP